MIWLALIYSAFFIYTCYLSSQDKDAPYIAYPLVTFLSPFYLLFVDIPERYRQFKVYRDNSYVSQLVKTLDFNNPEPVKFVREKTLLNYSAQVRYSFKLTVGGEPITLTQGQREYLDRRYYKHSSKKQKLKKQETENKNEELARKALGHDKFVTNQIRKDYENLFPIQTIKNPP